MRRDITAYDADYQPTGGPAPMHLRVEVNYQEVSKLQLPQKLDVAIGTPVNTRLEVTFTDCSVETK